MLIMQGCEPIVTTFDDVETPIYYEAASIMPTDTVAQLVVMTWNIKFGGGSIDFWFDCHDERVLMTEDEVIDNMAAVAAKIRSVNPDILILQEVDVNAKRSAFVDQLQYLLDHTDMNYGIYASHWKSAFIPSDGLGRMDSGNAIMTRWKLKDAERIRLVLREDQDALTQYFYLRRNIIKARLDLPNNNRFFVVGIHVAAYSQDGTKQLHVDKFNQVLHEINTAGGLFVAGGDLNTLPPSTTKLDSFPDAVCTVEQFSGDDYTDEVGSLSAFYKSPIVGGFYPAVSLADYGLDNTPYLTFSSNPEFPLGRKLDYLFTNIDGGWVAWSDSTHQDISTDTHHLSDHAPVSVEVVLP